MLTLTDISLQFAGDLLYKHVDLIFPVSYTHLTLPTKLEV